MVTEPSIPPLRRGRIRFEALQAILGCWHEGGSAEPCGLLVGSIVADTVRIEHARPTANAHPTPDRAYAIATEEQTKARRAAREEALEVVGAWHGHRVGAPVPGTADEVGLLGLQRVEGRPRVLAIVGPGAGTAPVVKLYADADAGSGEALREIPLRKA